MTVLGYNDVRKSIPTLCIKILTDRKYWTVDLDEWRKIAKEFSENAEPYHADRYDCDDFATNFKCFCVSKYELNCVGIVLDFISRHAYNCIVDSNKKFYLVEPQTGSIFTMSERRLSDYFFYFSLVIF